MTLSERERRIPEQMIDAQKLGKRAGLGVAFLGGEDRIAKAGMVLGEELF
jgi:hypothetical protein